MNTSISTECELFRDPRHTAPKVVPDLIQREMSIIVGDKRGLGNTMVSRKRLSDIRSPDNPTNHLLLEVELHMRSSSNKRELNVYGPPPINLE
ncbi:hypothetical protein L208DRAFT_1386695 [Tricholoma matsutake]|nr:hypothetical protein L208DRAFT_1386695 [Tricholoma matsutake 945]